MFITVSESYIPIHQIEINSLRSPLNGQTEKFLLVLYQKQIDTSFSTSLKGKLRGTYFTADGTEIAPRQWTQEMRDTFHDEQGKLRDIYSGTKLKWPVWVMIAIGVIGMVALANTLYELVDGGHSKNTALTELRDNVKVGDELFGWYSDEGKTMYGWVKIVEVDGDRFGLQLSKDRGDKGGGKSGDYTRGNYEVDTLIVNTKVQYEAFTLTSSDYRFNFVVLEKG